MIVFEKRFYLALLSDLILFFAAFYGGYALRFDFQIPPASLAQFWRLLPVMLALKSSAFIALGLYRTMWRYTSMLDFWKLLFATLCSTAAVSLTLLFTYRFHGFSRAVFLIDLGLTLLFTGGIRMLVRAGYSKAHLFKLKFITIPFFGKRSGDGPKKKKVVIVGAGSAGEKLIREINDNRALNYSVKALIDDDHEKFGRTIHGVKVMGSVEDLPNVVRRCGASEVLIAIPSASGGQIRRIITKCEACSVPFKTLPGLSDLVRGRISVKELRDVSYEDLLGRPQAKLDLEGIKSYLKDARVLVTGAGGSIGCELCRQISRFAPELIVLLDAAESNLFNIQMELKHSLRFSDYAAVLADIKNRELLTKILSYYKPDVIVHAAAYKHVPMLERNPWEAVHNNILGTRNLMKAAISFNTSRFVMVSTDKAVRPTNVMGASKRVCELLMQTYQGENGCKMMCVRFGNVVGSAGSVVPLFRQQIARGGPVTVTHPDVTRYFMTIPEACQLIIQAGALGKGGEVFILEMGEPVKIMDMARDLIRLSGREPDKDIEIIVTGLRPGEKLCEELITVGEGIEKTSHEKIMMLKSELSLQDTANRHAYRAWLNDKLQELKQAADCYDGVLIRTRLHEIVPEYEPSESVCVL
jgi:FlaA1/EpsC-like NDP-sugar epimerase